MKPMYLLTRRAFVYMTAAFSAVGTVPALAANSPAVDPLYKPLMSNGIFGVYVSQSRVIMIIRSAGSAPIPVVFDTGTNGNAIDTKIARSLGLKRLKSRINTVVDGATGKSFDAFEYNMTGISIGNMTIGDRIVAAYPYDQPDEVGVFGPNLFLGQMVLIDLGAARVRVLSKSNLSPDLRRAIPYMGSPGNGLPAVAIALPPLEGFPAPATVLAKLDSGNNNALNLPPSFIDTVPLKRPATIVGRATSITGTRDVMGSQIRGTVKIGSVTLVDPEVVFDGRTPNVGLPVIRQLRFMLDPEAELGWLVDAVELQPEQRASYVGQYGIRRISVEEGQLVYQREGGAKRIMTPLGFDMFDLNGVRDQVEFERMDGQVTKLVLVTSNNQLLSFDKTDPA
jgi:hypothetical protein